MHYSSCAVDNDAVIFAELWSPTQKDFILLVMILHNDLIYFVASALQGHSEDKKNNSKAANTYMQLQKSLRLPTSIRGQPIRLSSYGQSGDRNQNWLSN